MTTTEQGASNLDRVRNAALGGDRPYVVALGAAVALGVVVVSGPVQSWLAQRERVETLESQLEALDEENEGLAGRAEELRDPDEVALTAREQQGMVEPGQVPYVIVPPVVDEPVIGAEPPAAQDDDRGVLRRVWEAVAGLLGG